MSFKVKIIKLLLLISFVFLAAHPAAGQESLKINFIDIGEGDAVLIQAEGENALIDTGGLLTGYKLMDRLLENNAASLKYLIFSHCHFDHTSGGFFIIPKLRIEEIFDNGQRLDNNNDIERWYGELVRARKNYSQLKKGDRLKLGRASLIVLWPVKPDAASANSNSLVIRLAYGKFSCLLAGDLNQAGEKRLLKVGLDLKSDVLKVGHRGFWDATSAEFLTAVSPVLAVISVDQNNRAGAPSPQVLGLLRKKGIKVYRTDKNGDIIIKVDRDGNYSVEPKRGD
jgi:competence protein ComEC